MLDYNKCLVGVALALDGPLAPYRDHQSFYALAGSFTAPQFQTGWGYEAIGVGQNPGTNDSGDPVTSFTVNPQHYYIIEVPYTAFVTDDVLVVEILDPAVGWSGAAQPGTHAHIKPRRSLVSDQPGISCTPVGSDRRQPRGFRDRIAGSRIAIRIIQPR